MEVAGFSFCVWYNFDKANIWGAVKMKTNESFNEFCKENVIVNFEGDLHVFTESVAFTDSSSTLKKGDKEYIKTEADKGADIKIVN